MRKLFMRVMAMGTAGGLALAAWGDGIAVGYRQLGVVDVPEGVLKTEFVTGGDTLEAMAIGTMLMVR